MTNKRKSVKRLAIFVPEKTIRCKCFQGILWQPWHWRSTVQTVASFSLYVCVCVRVYVLRKIVLWLAVSKRIRGAVESKEAPVRVDTRRGGVRVYCGKVNVDASAKTAVTQHAIFHGLTCYFFFNMLEFKFWGTEFHLACLNTNNMLKTKQHVIDI